MRKGHLHLILLLLLIVGLSIFGWVGARKQTRVSLIKQPISKFPLVLKWEKILNGSGYGSPTYQDGFVFFAVNNSLFNSTWYGLEAATGNLVWSQQVKGWSSSLDCLMPQFLIIHSFEGFLNLSAQSGEIVWRREEDRWSTACSDDLIVAVVPRGTLMAFDPFSGGLRWQSSLDNTNFYSVIYHEEVQELIGVGNGNFYIIDPGTGNIRRILRSFDNKIPFGLTNSSLISEGQLFSEGGVMDIKTGEITRLDVSSGLPPAILSDKVYFSAFDEGVVVLDREAFQEKWTYLPTSSVQAQNATMVTLTKVVVLDNIGYVIFSDATLRAFDLETGQELGYWQPGDDILANWPSDCLGDPAVGSNCTAGVVAGIAVAEDKLVVSFGGNKLYALGKP